MSAPRPRRTRIGPVDCFTGGLELIKADYVLVLAIALVAVLFSALVPLGILVGPMMCGLVHCFLALERGERLEFGRLWRGFDHFLPSLAALVIQVAIVLALTMPFYALFLFLVVRMEDAGSDASAVLGLGAFASLGVFTLLCFALEVAFVFVYQLLAEHELSGWQAIRLSAAAAMQNPAGLTGLVLLNALVIFLAALACLVPLAFVLPVSYAAVFRAYRKVFPRQEGIVGGEPL